MTVKSFLSLLLGGTALWGWSACSESAYQQPDAPIIEVPFTQVHLDDGFWTPRIETNRTVSIPSAFRECEKNGRFDNFAIAAGLMKGEHRGDFSFDDTDPYKIIEGASYSLAVKYDKALDAYLDSVIHLIASAQESDGYLTTCVTNKCYRLSGWWGTRRWEKINSHELYNCGHLYEAAVAHYRATGKRTLLDVAIKNADLVCQVFGDGENQIHRPGGHPIVEMALCKLYKATGDEKYLRQAKYFVDETGRCTDGHHPSEYSQDHKPILQQEEIVGHAVRAGYLYSGVADVAALTQDTAYFNALTRIWDNMASRKLYLTGGIGSRPQGEGFGPDYELNNHTAYCETCASIANVYWNHRMFLATGDARYIDVLERALYNGVISGVSLSGDKFFYDNPLESMGQHERQHWFGCACCPGNVTRFMASIPYYMYATQGSDVYVNLYIAGTAEIEVDEETSKQGDKGTSEEDSSARLLVNLSTETNYPWEGKVKLTVTPDAEREFALRLRIPGWAQGKPVPTDLYSYTTAPLTPPKGGIKISVNGKSLSFGEVGGAILSDGYATISRTWRAGDVVEIDLPMAVRRVKAHQNVEDDRGKLAIERGPIVYCLEGKDQADSTVFNKYIPDGTEMEASYVPLNDFINENHFSDADDTDNADKKLKSVSSAAKPASKEFSVVVLSGTAQEVQRDGTVKEVPFRAIPYSTWNNRGADEMAVWIPASADVARPTPEPTLASRSMMYSLPTDINSDAPAATSNLQEGWGYNDQWEPRRSSDISKPYHYWWLRRGTRENICYRFPEATTVSGVEVYWLDFDHYDGNYRVPASWKLLYRDGGQWREVEATGDYPTKKDCWNRVEFRPVKATDLMISAQLQEGESGGVIEWKVF